MTWIKTETGVVLNASRLQSFAVWESRKIRQQSSPDGTGTVTYKSAPTDGYCVVAWDGEEPLWLTNGHTKECATEILNVLYATLATAGGEFDVAHFLRVMDDKEESWDDPTLPDDSPQKANLRVVSYIETYYSTLLLKGIHEPAASILTLAHALSDVYGQLKTCTETPPENHPVDSGDNPAS